MQPREAEEPELAFDLALDRAASAIVDRVPFVDPDYKCPTGFENVTGDVRILVGDALLGVEQQYDDVGVLDRLQRLDHRELLDRLGDLAAPAHACGIDERISTAAQIEVEIKRVASRARLRESTHALFAEKRVHQRRLAYVRAADNRDPDALVLVGRRIVRLC